jgi:hypothetical protein
MFGMKSIKRMLETQETEAIELQVFEIGDRVVISNPEDDNRLNVNRVGTIASLHKNVFVGDGATIRAYIVGDGFKFATYALPHELAHIAEGE